MTMLPWRNTIKMINRFMIATLLLEFLLLKAVERWLRLKFINLGAFLIAGFGLYKKIPLSVFNI